MRNRSDQVLRGHHSHAPFLRPTILISMIGSATIGWPLRPARQAGSDRRQEGLEIGESRGPPIAGRSVLLR